MVGFRLVVDVGDVALELHAAMVAAVASAASERLATFEVGSMLGLRW